nr:5-methyltetrahydropteroyltriglutamate--homocysteine S-methyltransferase [Bacilli bacterium]
MLISVIGFPRIGANRELKRLVENYLKGSITQDDLLQRARDLRKTHWRWQKEKGIDWIPSNDFSFYDTMLDTACLVNAIPLRYTQLGLCPLDTYFAMAKGYQGENGDQKALPMKKWFTTNYHYIVPEITDETTFRLADTKLFDEYKEAQEAGFTTKPVLIGPFTFLKLSDNKSAKSLRELANELMPVYQEILVKLGTWQVDIIAFDEPSFVTDITPEEKRLIIEIYEHLLAMPNRPRLLLQTYFGDVRDLYDQLIRLPFDALGLDFVEGEQTMALILQYGFPQQTHLVAGMIHGKNIWADDHQVTRQTLQSLQAQLGDVTMVISTSCSLLHVPYTKQVETTLPESVLSHFSFAMEKLVELKELANSMEVMHDDRKGIASLPSNFPKSERSQQQLPDVRAKIAALTERDFIRLPTRSKRREIQKTTLGLPLLPTTTIGSFPQTAEIKKWRKDLRDGKLDEAQYNEAIRTKIKSVIAKQEELGLDVFVHGEYERNDMVEFFGEQLEGFLFTQKGWVQSYGTRCVKPPIIFSDVKRRKAMTVALTAFANQLTDHPVKGMLTGPITMLNWSFHRVDIPKSEIAMQIALAIKEEVHDLEKAGITIIQIDEAALREKLPLRMGDWDAKYLSFAIPAFRLVHASVQPQTQIHTHMCYSEFQDIIEEIDQMDADVITFEAARSDLALLQVLQDRHFQTQVGPGVYDIHSPRIPQVDEIKEVITQISSHLTMDSVWINPDCGLKTRGEKETWESLQHMVQATIALREAFE